MHADCIINSYVHAFIFHIIILFLFVTLFVKVFVFKDEFLFHCILVFVVGKKGCQQIFFIVFADKFGFGLALVFIPWNFFALFSSWKKSSCTNIFHHSFRWLCKQRIAANLHICEAGTNKCADIFCLINDLKPWIYRCYRNHWRSIVYWCNWWIDLKRHFNIRDISITVTLFMQKLWHSGCLLVY